MVRKFTTSYDELIRNYYGDAGKTGLRDTVSLDELFANYYGKASVLAEERKKNRPVTVMSLAHDNGEVLVQRPVRRQPSQYGYQQSPAAAEFEEYVVTNDVAMQSSVAMSAETPPIETADVRAEYAVDILAPLQESPAASSKTTAEENRNAEPSSPAVASAKEVAREELSRAKVSENDIIGDLEAILKGDKVYDPHTKKTVDKNVLSGVQSTSNLPPAPAGDGQAIFDRIAQSMSYANKYDVGTVELENRFSDFDRMAELQQNAEQNKKQNSQYVQPYSVTPRPTVNSEHFIEDLDAIRRHHPDSGASSSSIAESMSAAIVEEMDQSKRDPVCRPWALSLSASDNPADYSRPLYDAGEHVMTGWDLYTDQLRVGQAPGVMFSYGHLIAMGDLYANVDQMMQASVAELKSVKNLLSLSQRYYSGGRADRSLDVSDDNWVNSIGDRYIDLAEDNYAHFAPNNIYKNEPWVANVGKHSDNKYQWRTYHTRAITEAQKILQSAGSPTTPPFLEWPLIINGFGDHFLTDAFSAGHTISKDATIELFKYNFFNGKSLKSTAEKFFERVAQKAFKGEVEKKFSVLETFEPVFLWWNPNIDTVNAFRKLLMAIAEQKPDEIANLAVLALHDDLNEKGVEVSNDAGDGTWRLTGDGLLDAKNLEIIKKAVQQSVDNVNDPANATSPNIAGAIDKVWKHVPRLTEAGMAQAKAASATFTDPNSDRLVEVAAKLIAKKVDIMIKKLLAAKKLKYA